MHSKLYLSTKLNNNNKTVIDDYYAEQPFKILTVPDNLSINNNTLHIIQMSSSPGILADDDIHIDFTVNKHNNLYVTNQAFTHILSMPKGKSAYQQINLSIKEDASLSFFPYPTVLHKDCDFSQTYNVNLQHSSKLFFSDIVSLGRIFHNENSKFYFYSSSFNCYLNKQLHIHDNIKLKPNLNPLDCIGQLENYTHQGVLYLIDTNKEIDSSIINHIYEQLQPNTDCFWGISIASQYAIIIRAVSYSADSMLNLFDEIFKKYME